MKLAISETDLLSLGFIYRGTEVQILLDFDLFWKKACTQILKQWVHRLDEASILSFHTYLIGQPDLFKTVDPTGT